MKKIAFKNFRRFQEFPTLDLGNISIMVGRNNSGKSTMVKAILLVLDYLQNQQYNEFSFTNKSLEDANIVTFGRAKNNKSKSNEIVFDIELDGFYISIFIYGDEQDTYANVSKLLISDDNSKIYFEINYNQKIISISKKNAPVIETNIDSYLTLNNELKDLNSEIQKEDFKKTTPDGIRILDRYNNLLNKLNDFNQIFEKNKGNESYLFEKQYPIKLDANINKTEETVLQEFISDFIYINDTEIKKIKVIRNNYVHKTGDYENIEENLETIINNDITLDDNSSRPLIQQLEEKIQELVDIDNYKSELKKSINKAVQIINETQIYYLGANPSKQSALFSIRDKQNNLAQAIHEFKQFKIYPEHDEYFFVKKWMKEFEVGEDFHIEFYAGEAYEFYVIDKDGDKAHLADKGMGSLQIMMLILKVAIIMRKHKGTINNVTIIVEEPELNLHPEFQGKLTDFFHDVNKEHHISFIIETHSEYLIRKSQNIVVKESYTDEEGLNPNPFKVFYFDLENGPYEMKYQENGKFDRKFGKGFFDYADELEVETYKLNLKKNK
jgi:predicted ATPase